MQRSSTIFFTVVMFLFSSGALAGQVYRSVDEEGRVTYSDKPPPSAADVEEVEVQPAPSGARQREGMERVRRMESQADELGEARARRTPPQPEQKPAEEVQPTEVIQTYDDASLDPYERARRREALKQRAGERPAQLPAQRPGRRPATGPGGGGRGR
jgi:hypothetical protein